MNGQLNYRLTLDESDYESGLRKANSQLANWKSQASQAGSTAAGLGTSGAAAGKAAATGWRQATEVLSDWRSSASKATADSRKLGEAQQSVGKDAAANLKPANEALANWRSQARQATSETRKLNESMKGLGKDAAFFLRKSSYDLSAWTSQARKAGGETGSLSSMIQMAKGAAVVVTAIKAVELAYRGARAAYLQFAETDRLERALAATMGSADAARARLVTLRDVARNPGLGLEEAARGDIRLQAVEISAVRAERILRSVGNALASAGAGKAELDGVIVALSQMAAKGVVSAEEVNQIAERMPQIRKAMKDAFGTADTESLQAMKISVDDFIDGVVTQLEQLPRVSGGAANAIENLDDSWKNLKSSVGKGIAPLITPGLENLGKLVDDISGALDGVSPAENKRLAAESVRFAQQQADAAKEKAAAEKEAAKAIAQANNEASRQVEMARLASEYAEKKAAAEKEARAAAMLQGTSATRGITEILTPEDQLLQKDLDAAMAKAKSFAEFINGTARDFSNKRFTLQDFSDASFEEKDLTKKAAMRTLLLQILQLQQRQRDLAARTSEALAAGTEETMRQAGAHFRAASSFDREGRILAARASGNGKLVEQLERQARIEDLKLKLMEEQGLASEEAEKKARERIALEERAAKPRRGLRSAEESAANRYSRLSAADQKKVGGTFRGFLDRDRTTRNGLSYRANLANRAAEFGTPGRRNDKRESNKLESYAAKQQATLESIEQRMASLGLAT